MALGRSASALGWNGAKRAFSIRSPIFTVVPSWPLGTSDSTNNRMVFYSPNERIVRIEFCSDFFILFFSKCNSPVRCSSEWVELSGADFERKTHARCNRFVFSLALGGGATKTSRMDAASGDVLHAPAQPWACVCVCVYDVRRALVLCVRLKREDKASNANNKNNNNNEQPTDNKTTYIL